MKSKQTLLDVAIYILFGLPLLIIYPFILLANLMTIAGEWTGYESRFLVIIIFSFIIMSSLYPVTYILSLILFTLKGKLHRKLWVRSLPAIHLSIVLVLIWMWSMLS